MSDVLTSLRQKLGSMSRTERLVTDAVLNDPGLVLHSTITELAESVGVSTASVTRMCRAAGFAGYKDFRLAFASAHSREEASREHFQVADADISTEDSVADLVSKVAYQEVRAIEDTARALDLAALDAAAAALGATTRVEVFGVGSSSLTAQDLQLKLHRIGTPTFCWSDTHLALTSVASTDERSVVLGISHSGYTLETQQLLALARERGATTIAITNDPSSPVALAADIVLTTVAREAAFRTAAMSSRLAQMVIVDFLVVRVVQRNFATAERLLVASHDAVREHKLPRR
ncbi:MAG: MurR/RpiR family transcriptional regulator [Microbacterium sp.]|jgi:DNA-binding MurR/RpiR family transcriptional regulator|nr:MurR/RpiR family transcriptional regulator [Microbacterium sp.]